MDSNILTSTPSLIASLDRSSVGQSCPQVLFLRNERMVTMLTAAGSGYLELDGLSVTRWRPDPTADADGYFIYLRDLDSGKYWSATYQPTQAEPESYQVEHRRGAVRFTRVDDQLHTQMDVFLSLEANVEFRQITITNHGDTNRRIELTSYAEIVLQGAAADASHPAYSKLFVETQQSDSGVLVARRRPRQGGDPEVSACHFLVGKAGQASTSFETDRKCFLGRGNSTRRPIAMQSIDPLPGTVGSVLDPVFSLRRVVTVAPKKSVSLVFALGAGTSSAALVGLAKRFESLETVTETLANAESADNPFHFQSSNLAQSSELAAAGLYHLPYTNSDATSANSNAKLEKLDSVDGEALEFLQHYGLAVPAIHGITSPEQSGSVSSNGASKSSREPSFHPANSNGDDKLAIDEPLLHDNGRGGFSADGKEYVIRLNPTGSTGLDLPPCPWANIISNEKIGFIASETGAGYTWAGNSRLNRLTPWQNDPVTDSHGEAIFIRDEDVGSFWSVTPGPVPQSEAYEVRHGIGYSRYRHHSNDFEHELIQFVPVEDSVKISWVRLKNTSELARRISVFSYQQWELNDGDRKARINTKSSIDTEQQILFATNCQRGVFAGNYSFSTLVAPSGAEPVQSTCDRFEFLGPHGDLSAPRAVTCAATLSGRAGQGFDQCAASKTSLEIGPGETVEFAVLLGESPDAAEAFELIERYRAPQNWATALDEVNTAWSDRLSAVQIETPSSATNLMVNGWLPYQNLSCRMWGRSSLYQSGGAYGYRDQLQDSAALIHHLPDLTRRQILLHAAHQFSEGDVMHWWHPPQDLGIRTMFSDDLLWLPLFSAEYVETTGDSSLWLEQVPFLTGTQLPAGEAEIMLTPDQSSDSGTLYEHCCRALDRGLTVGRHGLPLMGCGDWNDGMNRVGLGGTGESVWMGFFIDYILGKMLPVCEHFDDRLRLERYLGYREQLRSALHDAGWDGGWYRRAYFDDGTPLGTAAADECQIDALVQAWAVLSGADTPERAEKAMTAAAARLVDEEAGLIQLLDPPFDKMENDPGYIKGYLPGVRENGGQYTHGVLWFIRAMAEMGKGTQAVKLLEMISPINHARTPEEVAIYQTEPYVIAADVYSQAPHAGRGGWSWYTGSAGWMWRVAVESILGVKLVGGNTLEIDPRISADWPECRVNYRLSDKQTVYEILIRNPQGREVGVTECELNGQSLSLENSVARVPLEYDGAMHQVVVTL